MWGADGARERPPGASVDLSRRGTAGGSTTLSESVYEEPAELLRADEFVPVTVYVHVDDLASFYGAVAEWWKSVDGEGAKGRLRVM